MTTVLGIKISSVSGIIYKAAFSVPSLESFGKECGDT
jgi:hypothetical protein